MKLDILKNLVHKVRWALCRHKWERNGAVVICRKCLKIDTPASLRNLEIKHPGNLDNRKNDRLSPYYEPGAPFVNMVPEHRNTRNCNG